MARPKKSQEETKTVSIRIPPRNWDALKRKAQILGLNRTELINLIAEGKVAIGEPSDQMVILGKS